MRSTSTVVSSAIAVAGLILALVGVFADGAVDSSDVRALGIGVGMSSLTWFLITRARRSEEDVYEAGRQAGYEAGMIAGRRVARPVVVSLDERRTNRTVGVPSRDSDYQRADISGSDLSR